jgi:hypothetical protein
MFRRLYQSERVDIGRYCDYNLGVYISVININALCVYLNNHVSLRCLEFIVAIKKLGELAIRGMAMK